MLGGYMGQILVADLSKGHTTSKELSEDFCRKYLGGYGFGARYLYDHQSAGIHPLSDASILGIVTGPLTGTSAISGTRYLIVGKSPLTGGWGDSNSGGRFGPVLKFAGFDGVFFHGAAQSPVYLYIDNENAELLSADDLWGSDTLKTEEALKERHGKDSEVACIGPAGERLSLISGIYGGRRCAARSGLGALMGSKYLKAIVVRGKKRIREAQPEVASQLRAELLQSLGGPWYALWRKFGTAGALSAAVECGDAPVKNWAGAGLVDFPNASAISDSAVLSFQKRRFACWQCPVGCGGFVSLPENDKQDLVRKPEYETLAAFGPLCLLDDLEMIIAINNLCDRAGLDTISAGATVAFAIECAQNGLLSNLDLDGLSLSWGNGKAMLELVQRMIRREGIGDLLADGVRVAAAKIGGSAPDYAMHIGGQELPMHDPRLTWPFLIGYSLDATPSRHNQGSAGLVDMPETWNRVAGAGITSAEGFNGKAVEHFKLANLMHVINAAGLCSFGVCSFEDRFVVPEFFEYIIGWSVSSEDLFQLGDRIGTIRLAFNIREGITPSSWKIPGRVLGYPPLEAGPLKGVTVDVEDELLAYRQAAGWDPESGKPTIEKLKNLNLEDLIPDLWSGNGASE